jgi:hypothetical protein
MKICREIPNLVTVGQTYRTLYVKNLSPFYCSRQSKIAIKALFGTKCYQAVRIADEVKTPSERATILRYNTYIGHLRPGNPRLFSTFRNMESFRVEELLALRPTPKMEMYPLSAVRDCVFNIYATALRFPQPQPEDAPSRGVRDPLIMELKISAEEVTFRGSTLTRFSPSSVSFSIWLCL